MQAHRDFRALESVNRRQTGILVAVMLMLLVVLGFLLDLWIGAFAIVNGHLAGFPVLTCAALAFGSVQALISYYGGASLVLMSVHARPLDPDSVQHQTVLDVINEMSIASRLPVPKAYVIEDPSPNAFATGRDPSHSVLCVTQGLIDQMDREELQGVVGHEMSHIADYDIRTMTMVAVMVGGIAMLSDFLFRIMFFTGGRGGRRSGNSSEGGGAGLLIGVAVIVLAAIAPIIAQLVAMAVSRQREYLADASSVEFTRNPRALLRALQKIAQVESPLKEGTAGTAHLFIVNPRESATGDDEGGFFENLFSTHPPLGKRIERLQAIAGASAAPAATSLSAS